MTFAWTSINQLLILCGPQISDHVFTPLDSLINIPRDELTNPAHTESQVRSGPRRKPEHLSHQRLSSSKFLKGGLGFGFRDFLLFGIWTSGDALNLRILIQERLSILCLSNVNSVILLTNLKSTEGNCTTLVRILWLTDPPLRLDGCPHCLRGLRRARKQQIVYIDRIQPIEQMSQGNEAATCLVHVWIVPDAISYPGTEPQW